MFEAHKINTLQIGKFYQVWHAECEWRGQTYEIPVIPNLHADPQFGGLQTNHYHIDGRFKIDAILTKVFSIQHGYTNHAIAVTHGEIYIGNAPLFFKKLLLKKSKCLRLTTGVKPPLVSENYWETKPSKWFLWYQKQIGKSCAGKKCPHYGAKMIDNGTHLVCPLHNLHGDRETELIIQYPYAGEKELKLLKQNDGNENCTTGFRGAQPD